MTLFYFKMVMSFLKKKLITMQDIFVISRTNVASVGSVFNDTRKVKVPSLPETIKEKSTFRNVDFSFIVSGSERTFTFRIYLLRFSC